MHVRVARCERVDPSRAEAMVEEMRGQMDAMRRGETPEGIPAEAVAALALRDDIARGMSLLDRERSVSLFLAFADDEAAIRRVDAALSSRRPTSLLIRDITSPVRLRVKKPTEWPSSRSNSCQRRSAMIPWLIDVDRYEPPTFTIPFRTAAPNPSTTSITT